jgi:hypothetical protein
MSTSTYTLTITTDDDVEHDAVVSRAAVYLIEALDPAGRSPILLTVTDAAGNPIADYDYDPSDAL